MSGKTGMETTVISNKRFVPSLFNNQELSKILGKLTKS